MGVPERATGVIRPQDNPMQPQAAPALVLPKRTESDRAQSRVTTKPSAQPESVERRRIRLSPDQQDLTVSWEQPTGVSPLAKEEPINPIQRLEQQLAEREYQR